MTFLNELSAESESQMMHPLTGAEIDMVSGGYWVWVDGGCDADGRRWSRWEWREPVVAR